MSMFQKSVVNKYLACLEKEKVEKAYQAFKENYTPVKIDKIKKLKEEEYQDGFLRDLFVDALEYIIKPDDNYNLLREFKNQSDGKKADGAILIDGKAIAIIELKSTKTKDLKSITQQAFNYKNNQPECKYVITSNFQKLRFYIDYANEYEEFDLFNISKEDFKLLYLILSKDSIFADIPLKLKKETIYHEENVSEQLYKDYSIFKNFLFENLIRNNSEHDKLMLFKKSQKLIDRILFILFAEDRGLLPPNFIDCIIQRFNTLKEADAYKPLYDIYKQYFVYMNIGHNGPRLSDNIPAYNGGLFSPDEVLDKLKIDDEILIDDIRKLSAYDFNTEVDVNILGHIFEHSLSEIEEITAGIEGVITDKNKSKRKKDGIFYTPKYITQYIVENTIGRLCEENRKELDITEIEFDESCHTKRGKLSKKGNTLYKKLEDYKDWLLSLKILDPACGSGAFLNQALNFLINEHNFIIELQTDLQKGQRSLFDVEAAVLENNLYGVDINEESVEIAKLSLWLRTAKKGRKLSVLSNNIKCGNSLIDDLEVAGGKAFDWNKEFPDVMQEGGFDVVIGNPPYVFAREKISQDEKGYYSKRYTSADYQINTYLLFMEKSIDLIKRNGSLGLIVPNAWLMVYSGQGLRKYILDTCKLNQIINLKGYSFEGVNVETIIILAEKEKINDCEFDIYLSKEKDFVFSHKRNQMDFSKNDGLEFKVFSDENSLSLTNKIKSGSVILNAIVQIKAGLQAYEKGKGTPKQTVDDVKERPYDYDYKFDDNTHKYLEGKDVGRYFVSWSGLYLRYGAHLAAPRTFNLFTDKKIIIREITGKYPKSIIATYSEDTYLYNRSNIAIVEMEDKDIYLKYILIVLNSSLISYYFMKNTAKSVREMFPKIILKDLRLFPFKEINKEQQQPFVEKADKILKLNQQLQEKTFKFLNRIRDNLEIEKISKKLEAFYDFDFRTFVAEIKKQKIKLSLVQQDEWEEYFVAYKSEINQLQTEITTTDKTIDQMVYELYGLTEDEIKIVETNKS